MKTKNTIRQLMLTVILATLAWLPSANAQQPCQALFTYTVTNPNPSSYVVNLYDSSWTAGTITNWQWTLGNGTAAQGPNPVVTFTSPGNYLVCLTITAVYQNQTCTSTYCDTIVVPGNPPPGCQAYFIAYPDSTNNSVYFSNQSQASSASAYYWTFGDGGTSTQMDPTHIYASTGWYQVCLTVIDSSAGCSDTYCDSVYTGTTISNCNAYFTFNVIGNTVSLTNLATGSYTNFIWDFGDNSTSTATNPTHTYTSPGVYQLCLTVWNNTTGCQHTFCANIVIGTTTNCQASFTYTASPSGGVVFTSTSTGNPSVYTWSFGDGSSGTGPNPVHTYANTGWYMVCLTISTPGTTCQSTWCDSVYVGNSGICIADFGWNSTGGNNIAFNNNSTSGSASPYYYWDFGDGSTSWAINPTHNYASAGTYQVCLMLIDSIVGCADTYCTTVTVQGGGSGCSSNFALYPDSLVAHTYWAYNLASGNGQLTYLWSWGDSTTSTGAYPSHTYAGPGLYTICLTITDATGCSSTTCYQWQLLRLASGVPVTVNVVAGSTGINEAAEQGSLNVFPNPASELMNVNLTNNTGELATLELYNVEGRRVAELGTVSGQSINLSVDLNDIPAGMYFLRVSAGNWQKHLKVVIK